MSEVAKSGDGAGVAEVAGNPKREVDFGDAELAAKKPRTAEDAEEREEGRVFEIEADAAEDKGSRHAMEDAWVLLKDASLGSPGKLRCAHFAIYDGHGGRLAAEYAQKNLHANVLSAGLPHGC